MNIKQDDLTGLLLAFNRDTHSSLLDVNVIFGCLMVSGVEKKNRKNFQVKEIEDLLHNVVAPGIMDTLEDLRTYNANNGNKPFYTDDVVSLHTETDDYVGVWFEFDEIIDGYFLESNVYDVAEYIASEDIRNREVYVFRLTFNLQSGSAWDLASINLEDALKSYLSTNSIPTTVKKYR